MQTLGLGFTWEQLSPGQRFRTLNRTITETDLVLFIGVTGMLETIFIDRTFGADKGAIQGQFVPAALTYSLIEGLLCQSMIQGTGLAMLELKKQVRRAGPRRRHRARRDRGDVRAAHLERQSRHRRIQGRREEPGRRGRDDVRSHPDAGRPLARSRRRANGVGAELMKLQFSIGLTSNPRTWPIIDGTRRRRKRSTSFPPCCTRPRCSGGSCGSANSTSAKCRCPR